MIHRFWFLLLVVFLTIRSFHHAITFAQESKPSSVARYTPPDAFAGCVVRPAGLIADPYFGSLPYQDLLPGSVSLGRLERMGIAELAVFCQPAGEPFRKTHPDDFLEWSAAVRFDHAVDLPTVMKEWRDTVVLQDRKMVAPTPHMMDGVRCFRVPTGSFFPPPRKLGRLRFTDRKGELVEKGLSVGNMNENRTYVAGNTKSSAIFTFDGITAADLVEGKLPIAILLDVFRTKNLEHERNLARIELRNPSTGVRSQSFPVDVKSFVEVTLEVPRKIDVIEKDKISPGDLVDDLVADGQLEVVVRALSPEVYLGVEPGDVSVKREDFEYVSVSDQKMWIAQSEGALQAMSKPNAEKTPLAERLGEPGDLVLAGELSGRDHLTEWKQLARQLSGDATGELYADSLKDFMLTIDLKGSPTARFNATFQSEQDPIRARKQFRDHIATLRTWARKEAPKWIDVLAARSNLASMAMGGISMGFEDDHPPNLADRKSALILLLQDILDGFRATVNGNDLEILFIKPRSVRKLSTEARYGLAHLDEEHAHKLFERESFDLAAELLERANCRLPNDPTAWYRRAHQLSYNATTSFNAFEGRYAWVRRGVHALLDGAEQNPDKPQLLWMAARLIGWKVGQSDERDHYRKYFAEDDELHKRLAKWINLEKTRSADQTVDCWLVAKLLFEHCEKEQAGKPIPEISALLYFSRSAEAQALLADALTNAGHFAAGKTAWKDAEALYNAVGNRPFKLPSGEVIRLNDWNGLVRKLGPKDPKVKRLSNARGFLQFDYYLVRSRFEQTQAVELIRKNGQNAKQHLAAEEWKEALIASHQAIEILDKIAQKFPQEFDLIADEFGQLAQHYRDAKQKFAEANPKLLRALQMSISFKKTLDRLQTRRNAFPIWPLIDPETLEQRESPN